MDSGLLVENIYIGTFDLEVFKIIWRSFGALFTKWPLTQTAKQNEI